MTLYPEVQAKAQAEIAAYMRQRSINDGLSRMILPADRPNLPYTSALVHEVMRWHPIVTMVPHRSSSQDDCNVASGGKVYRIPAESLVLANVWFVSFPVFKEACTEDVFRRMMHDPEVYPEPSRFNPERYLVKNPPPEPENYAFGFGRRYVPI